MTKNAILFFLSLCVALAFAEVLTRLFVPVRNVGALFTVNDPDMGKRIKKNFHTVRVTPEFTMTFTSNSLGFRGPEPDSPPKNSVLFIGDSFTMGFGVNDGEEYPALIKAELDAVFGKNAVNVVNTGMGNSGNGRWIKLLKSEADQYKPQLVVLQVMANDFEDNVREGYFSVSDSGSLSELPINVSKMKFLEPFLDSIPGLSNSYFYGLIRQSFSAYSSDTATKKMTSKKDIVYADRLTGRLITEAVSICREKGIRFSPSWWDWKATASVKCRHSCSHTRYRHLLFLPKPSAQNSITRLMDTGIRRGMLMLPVPYLVSCRP